MLPSDSGYVRLMQGAATTETERYLTLSPSSYMRGCKRSRASLDTICHQSHSYRASCHVMSMSRRMQIIHPEVLVDRIRAPLVQEV